MRGHTSILYENERMQGLCHLISSNDLQYFGRTGAVETKNGNTNVAFGFFMQNGAATPCSSVPEELRQNSTKTAKKTVKNYNVIQNYYGYTRVTYFLDQAEQLIFRKSGVTMGVNEDELESTQKLQRKIVLKSAQKWKPHPLVPTKGL